MNDKPKGILFDMINCSGCRRCIAACMEGHGFEGDPDEVDDLSATAYTSMVVEDDYPLRNMCRHCLSPSCVSVCPVGALIKQDLGPVTWDADRCLGCRYCMVACPFNVPRYEWHSRTPKVQKCDMCFARIAEGKLPLCAEACPNEATVFGDRDELLALARERIRENPDEYHDHIYGATEIGGTSVMFLTPAPVERLGYHERLGTTPLPQRTMTVLKHVPGVLVCGGTAIMALWWITKRRNEVAAVEHGLQPRFGGGNGTT
jgi:formate dehydrogenase iron-sulfur subunit